MDVLQTNLSGAVLVLLQQFHDRYDKDHSLQYTLEDCLIAGINAKRRSKAYSEATENRKRFEREIATNPSVVLDPAKMLGLMKKYGIGASNANLEQQVIDAAERRAKQAEEEEEKRQLEELDKVTKPAA